MDFSENEFKFFIDLFAKANAEFDGDKQFFYNYVLFNHLYNFYDDETNPRESDKKRRKTGEKKRIEFFIEHVLNQNSACFSNYNPFAELNVCHQNAKHITKSGEIELIRRVREKQIDFDFDYSKKSSAEAVKALFLEIYEVRCDIFHGSADISDYETRELLEESNTVLKRFLDLYLQAFGMQR